MKTNNNKYRFTLQWSAETTEKTQAGEFFNSLGNRKSEFLVKLVTEYISAHPEIQINGQKPQILIKPCFAHEEIEKIVRAVVAENMKNAAPPMSETKDTTADPGSNETDIEVMLDNLDVFLQ